ncbi:MAG: acetyl-CoA carboxylase biotin carboxyl carrier protein subunit, partial [Bacteroidota bacterium]
DSYSVFIGNVSTQITLKGYGSDYQVLLGKNQVDVRVESERDRLLKKYATASSSTHQRYEIHAPMPALVVRIEVGVGDDVRDGQGLLILEAMKMENEIRSHQSGKVREIYVTKGKAVEKGELLMLLE